MEAFEDRWDLVPFVFFISWLWGEWLCSTIHSVGKLPCPHLKAAGPTVINWNLQHHEPKSTFSLYKLITSGVCYGDRKLTHSQMGPSLSGCASLSGLVWPLSVSSGFGPREACHLPLTAWRLQKLWDLRTDSWWLGEGKYRSAERRKAR